MTTSAGLAGLALLLDEIRRSAATAAADVLGHLPDTGDHAAGRAVDDFVEQAADALRALETVLAETTAVARRDDGAAATRTGDPHPPSPSPSPAERPGWMR